MHHLERIQFSTEQALLDFLEGETCDVSGGVAIVAGHYMLAYDNQRQCLVPMIWQDTEHEWIRHFSKIMAQDFPVRSFNCGLQLLARLRAAGQENSGIVVLVNDHIFQTDDWHQQQLPAEPADIGAQLRRSYFRSADPMPESFRALLDTYTPELQETAFIRNDNPSRAKTDIVPKKSILFSEQALRRRFDEKTRHALLKSEYFRYIATDHGKYRLYFRESAFGQQVCLIDECGCGCSGEVMELLLRLNADGVSTVVFFAPLECASPVHAGGKATAYVAEERGMAFKVITVSGLGGMGVEPTDGMPQQFVAETVSSDVT